MPAQPLWFQRLDSIRDELDKLGDLYLDRAAVESLFQVGERRARQLMAALPCFRIGNAAAVERRVLIDYVEGLRSSDRVRYEQRRRRRVAESLNTIRQASAARRVELPATPQVWERRVNDLGEGVELRRGELRIRFDGARDLATKLFGISQAMANDWDGFEDSIGY